MKAIVYTSNSGFTKKYAELLSQKVGLPAYDINSVDMSLGKDDEIIYMGWLKAGTVVKLNKAKKLFNIKAVCVVGMAVPDEKLIRQTIERHHIENAKVFYLQGGFDMNKLHGMDKFLMKIMVKIIRGSVEKKENKTQEDLAKLEMVNNGADYVREENLAPIIAWL